MNTNALDFDANAVFLPLLDRTFGPATETAAFSPFKHTASVTPMRDYCATISLTGPVSITLLTLLDHDLAWRIMQHEVAALGLEESSEMVEGVLGEAINIIGGNATAAFQTDNQPIHLSLPIIMQAAKISPGLRHVKIQFTSLHCSFGGMDVYCISPVPPELFA